MKILIVRTSSMGDLVHTLYAVTDLARFVPDVTIHWLAEDAFAAIPRLSPAVTQVIPFSWREARKKIFSPGTRRAILNLRRTLKSERYDLVIDSQGLIKSALLAKLAGAPVAGFARDSIREKWAASLYTRRYSIPEIDNVIWKNRQLFAFIFAYYDRIKRSRYRADLVIPPETDLTFIPAGSFHVAVTGASREEKRWPEENWQTLLRKRHQKDGLPVYLTWGGDAEWAYCQALAENLDFVRITPRFNLLQVAGLLQRAVSVISVDTGLLHLANALNRPTVGIYRTTSVANTRTEGRSWQQIAGNGQGEVSALEVAALWDKVLLEPPHEFTV